LRDLQWALEQSKKLVEEIHPNLKSSVLGQPETFARLIMGTLYEFLLIVEEDGALLDAWPPFKKCLDEVGSHCRETWSEVREVAGQGDEKSTLRHSLLMIRNNGAFHVSPKALARGLKDQEDKSEPPFFVMSQSGLTTEWTRHGFADSAALGARLLYLEEDGASMGQVEQLREDLLELGKLMIRSLLNALINEPGRLQAIERGKR
jgi:hypothetical protein